MGISRHRGTMPGCVTPCCNECGIHLCWDIVESEYEKDAGFWDEWKCQDCNDGIAQSLKQYQSEHAMPDVIRGN